MRTGERAAVRPAATARHRFPRAWRCSRAQAAARRARGTRWSLPRRPRVRILPLPVVLLGPSGYDAGWQSPDYSPTFLLAGRWGIDMRIRVEFSPGEPQTGLGNDSLELLAPQAPGGALTVGVPSRAGLAIYETAGSGRLEGQRTRAERPRERGGGVAGGRVD